MTVVDTGPYINATAAEQRRSTTAESVRVEPTIGLEWSEAIEQWGADEATAPAQARRAWLHRAPEHRVLTLYRGIRAVDPDAPAPWWLRALHAGTLTSRSDGFAVEDRVHKLLVSRPGWVFVPWAAAGDVGYWEYMPSERTLPAPGTPTTLVLTHRHPGWIDVIGAHTGTAPRPIPVAGPADLRATLPRLETITAAERS